MDQTQILAIYRAAWTLTQQMLEVAQAEEWDQLTVLEQSRAEVMDQLQQESLAAVDPQQGAEFAALIRNILATDRQIQALTQVWMGEINGVLNSVQVEKKLLKAYDAF